MEVHHHPHLQHSEMEKQIKYLFKFLMFIPVVIHGFKTLVTTVVNLKPTLLHYFKNRIGLYMVIRSMNHVSFSAKVRVKKEYGFNQ
ncbi:MAG: hypothetical protein JST21_16655 [Bacteroidetes bacterium]|nr:hypothetical protein [Bacteroidota bacterium]